MTNILLRRKAVLLRKQRKSYSQIKALLGISKSTLSEWLRAYPLTREEINNLRAHSEIRIEKYRQTMRKKREVMLHQYHNEEKKRLLPLSKRELLIAGLFLYWGEGDKGSRNMLSISNTDPKLVQFSLYWIRRVLDIPKNKVQIYVHLYKDMNIQQEMFYWSNLLKIPLRQFSKPYIKDSKRSDIDEKGYGHGTCGIRVYNTVVKNRTLMGIQVMAEHYVRKIV